jgi:hypothetical protein
MTPELRGNVVKATAAPATVNAPGPFDMPLRKREGEGAAPSAGS